MKASRTSYEFSFHYSENDLGNNPLRAIIKRVRAHEILELFPPTTPTHASLLFDSTINLGCGESTGGIQKCSEIGESLKENNKKKSGLFILFYNDQNSGRWNWCNVVLRNCGYVWEFILTLNKSKRRSYLLVHVKLNVCR